MQTASRNQRSWVTTSTSRCRCGQVPGQPVDGLDVEVVGRLVEDQQLGVLEQQPRQRDPPPLAARQRPDRRIQPAGQAGQLHTAEQPLEHAPEGGVAGPLMLGAIADQRRAHGV